MTKNNKIDKTKFNIIEESNIKGKSEDINKLLEINLYSLNEILKSKGLSYRKREIILASIMFIYDNNISEKNKFDKHKISLYRDKNSNILLIIPDISNIAEYNCLSIIKKYLSTKFDVDDDIKITSSNYDDKVKIAKLPKLFLVSDYAYLPYLGSISSIKEIDIVYNNDITKVTLLEPKDIGKELKPLISKYRIRGTGQNIYVDSDSMGPLFKNDTCQFWALYDSIKHLCKIELNGNISYALISNPVTISNSIILEGLSDILNKATSMVYMRI